jgi:hypothetical protein
MGKQRCRQGLSEVANARGCLNSVLLAPRNVILCIKSTVWRKLARLTKCGDSVLSLSCANRDVRGAGSQDRIGLGRPRGENVARLLTQVGVVFPAAENEPGGEERVRERESE